MQEKIVLKGKTIFYLFILVIAIVVVVVWFTGLDIHRTLLNNAIYSLTIITLIFFTFVTYGLYKGVGLTDNLGSIKSKIGFVEPSGISNEMPADVFPIGEFASEGFGGILVGIIMWIGVFLLTVVLAFLLKRY